jgi:HEAT repeat protein
MKLMTNMSLPTSERRQAAEVLAHDGSEAALAALKQAFANGSEDLRVAIAEALGKCGSPECTKWLRELLHDPSTLVAEGAVRGLAGQNTLEAADALIPLLTDTNAAGDLRCEVALNLGSMDQPGVLQALMGAAYSADDENLVEAALNALGSRDFAETSSFFQNFLNSPDVSSSLRVQALEALAQAQGDPSAFLASLASDSDSDVRAAAAWALSATETTGNVGPQLLALLQNETDADVRLRMYQALGNQESFDANATLAIIQNESDPSARVAGYDLLAKLLLSNPIAELKNYFDQTAVPWLKQMALTGPSSDDRQLAVIVLTRANTPEAMAALSDLSAQIAQMQNAAQPQSQAPASATPAPPPPRPNGPPPGRGGH